MCASGGLIPGGKELSFLLSIWQKRRCARELHYQEVGPLIWLSRYHALAEDLRLNYLQNCFGELLLRPPGTVVPVAVSGTQLSGSHLQMWGLKAFLSFTTLTPMFAVYAICIFGLGHSLLSTISTVPEVTGRGSHEKIFWWQICIFSLFRSNLLFEQSHACFELHQIVQ